MQRVGTTGIELMGERLRVIETSHMKVTGHLVVPQKRTTN
jgi:hypothetical protein